MKIILQHNVQKLGNEGDVVEVAPGYFRNFLQPRKLAVLATDGTLKKREEDIVILKKKAELAHQVDLQLADKIKQIGTIRVGSKSGEEGKLFGKITSKEIAAALTEALGGIEIDRRIIKSSEDINSLGTYKTVLKIARDVQAEINVEVFSEGLAEEHEFVEHSEAEHEHNPEHSEPEHSETEAEPA